MSSTHCSTLARYGCLALLLHLVSWSARGAVQFFGSEDATGSEFQQITDADFYQLGTQSMPVLQAFDQQSVGRANVFPGVAALPLFSNGTDVALGLTLQSNAGGEHPATPSPGSVLVVSGPLPDAGYPFSRIGPDVETDSLDILPDPPGFGGLIRAMSFAVRSENLPTSCCGCTAAAT